MRVCYLCSEYPEGKGGGAGTLVRELARRLVTRGIDVDVVGLYGTNEDEVFDDRGARVHMLRSARVPFTRFVRNGRKVRKALREIQRNCGIDIVEAQELGFASVGRLAGAKHVIRMQGGHRFFCTTLGRRPSAWRSWQERRSFALADAFCAVSKHVAETSRELLQLGNVPIEILPNFVDTEKFLPNDAEAEEGLIVFAGTVCEKKGVRQLIAAMPAILASVPHARLIIAGRDQMEAPGGGSFVEYLKSLMGPLVRERTVFLGPLRHSDLPGLLRKANVCVFPSHSESQGIVFLEAMATGKPQVAPRIPPVLEMMREGEHALFCDPREPESIAAAVVRLLKDPDLRARLGRAARERVVREFSAEVMVPRNIEFYERVLGMR